MRVKLDDARGSPGIAPIYSEDFKGIDYFPTSFDHISISSQQTWAEFEQSRSNWGEVKSGVLRKAVF